MHRALYTSYSYKCPLRYRPSSVSIIIQSVLMNLPFTFTALIIIILFLFWGGGGLNAITDLEYMNSGLS